MDFRLNLFCSGFTETPSSAQCSVFFFPQSTLLDVTLNIEFILLALKHVASDGFCKCAYQCIEYCLRCLEIQHTNIPTSLPHSFQQLVSISMSIHGKAGVKCCKERSESPIPWNSGLLGQTPVHSSMHYPDLKCSINYLIWPRIIIKPKISPVISLEERLQIVLSHFTEKAELIKNVVCYLLGMQ